MAVEELDTLTNIAPTQDGSLVCNVSATEENISSAQISELPLWTEALTLKNNHLLHSRLVELRNTDEENKKILKNLQFDCSNAVSLGSTICEIWDSFYNDVVSLFAPLNMGLGENFEDLGETINNSENDTDLDHSVYYYGLDIQKINDQRNKALYLLQKIFEYFLTLKSNDPQDKASESTDQTKMLSTIILKLEKLVDTVRSRCQILKQTLLSEKKNSQSLLDKIDKLGIEKDRLSKLNALLIWERRNSTTCRFSSDFAEPTVFCLCSCETCDGCSFKTKEEERRNFNENVPESQDISGNLVQLIKHDNDVDLILRERDAQIKNLEIELERKEDQIINLKLENVLNNDKIRNSEIFQESVQVCESLTAKLRTKFKEIEDLKNELTHSQVSAEELHNKYSKQLEEDRDKKTAEINKLHSLLVAADEEKQEAIVNCEKASSECEILRSSLKTLEQTVESSHARLVKLKKQRETIKSLCDKLLEKHETIKSDKLKLVDVLRKKIDCFFPNQCASQNSDLTEQMGCHVIQDLQFQNDEDLKNSYYDLKQEFDNVSEEIEEISKAFEDSQLQNQALVAEITEKNEQLIEKKKLEIDLDYFRKQQKKANAVWELKVSNMRQQFDQIERSVGLYVDICAYNTKKTEAADIERNIVVTAFMEARDVIEGLYTEKQQLECHFHRVLQIIKVLDTILQEKVHLITSLKSSIRQFEETAKEQEQRIVRFRQKARIKRAKPDEESNSESSVLANENIAFRRRLSCTVCGENFRDHVVSKCGHVFCKSCLDRNIRARNRKCPQCNVHYDQKDIRRIFLD